MYFFDIYAEELEYKFKNLSNRNRKKLAIMSIERQFKYYSKILENKLFNKSQEYRLILDKCWNFILFDTKLDEDIWYQQDKIHIEKFGKDYYDDDSFHLSNMLSTTCNNIMMFIEMLEDSEDDTEYTFLTLNLDYIYGYLNGIDCDKYEDIDDCENHFLTINELNNQKNDFKVVNRINTLEDVKEWLKDCKSII